MSLKDDLLRDMEDQAVHYGGAVWIAEWAARWMVERCAKECLGHSKHSVSNTCCGYALHEKMNELAKELK